MLLKKNKKSKQQNVIIFMKKYNDIMETIINIKKVKLKPLRKLMISSFFITKN